MRSHRGHPASRVPACAATLVAFLPTLVAPAALGDDPIPSNKIVPHDGILLGQFGRDVAIGDGYIVVGAESDDDNGANSGAVYVFDATTGDLLHKVVPADNESGDFFGRSVAIDAGVIAAGAHGDDDAALGAGAVYLFDAATGIQLRKLTASDAVRYDSFGGGGLDLRNGILVVGATGHDPPNNPAAGGAYVFNAASGEQIAKLLSTGGALIDNFGNDIAIDDGFVAIAARGARRFNRQEHGTVYLYNLEDYQLLGEFAPSDHTEYANFGQSIDMQDGLLVVGAYQHNGTGEDAGAAYLFDVRTRAQLARLVPSDTSPSGFYGISSAIGEGVVAVGAFWQDAVAMDSGAVYLFESSTGSLITKLTPPELRAGSYFGRSVAMNDGELFVGANQDFGNTVLSGAAYHLPALPCSVADRGAPFGSLNIDDIDAFITAFLGADLASGDCDANGVINVDDIDCFVASFLAGCP